MKKVILSAIIGALFGGAVVFATTQTPVSQQNQIVANAKGLPETPENKVSAIENKSTDNSEQVCNPNEVLYKNKKFYFKDKNSFSTFNIKKQTNRELEFELTYKNEKLNTPFVLSGVATAGFGDDEEIKTTYCTLEPEPVYIGNPDEVIDTNSDPEWNAAIYTYNYLDTKNNCQFFINRIASDDGNNDELKIYYLEEDKNISNCKKLKEIGIDNITYQIILG